METTAKGEQAKPIAVNTTGFNRWKFTVDKPRAYENCRQEVQFQAEKVNFFTLIQKGNHVLESI
jgi:hypothetical protein